MQQLYFVRRKVLICSMSLVRHRIHFIKVDWKCIFILYKIRTWRRCLKLTFFVHLCEVREDFNPVKQWLKCFFTRAVTTYKALPFSSIQSTLTSYVATHRKVFALLVYCIWSRGYFYFSVSSIGAFLSFTFFCSGSQLCVVGFLIKQFFYSSLLDMKWPKPTRGFVPR